MKLSEPVNKNLVEVNLKLRTIKSRLHLEVLSDVVALLNDEVNAAQCRVI